LTRPGGQDRQVPEELLAVGVDDDAVNLSGYGQRQGGLAAGGAAPYDDQRLDRTSPAPYRPELRCRPSPA
jgi:hypothetical protein